MLQLRNKKFLSFYISFFRRISIVLLLNSFLGFFLFLIGSYNIFLYGIQNFILSLTMKLSLCSFSLELINSTFFAFIMKKKIVINSFLILSFLISFLSILIKEFISGVK